MNDQTPLKVGDVVTVEGNPRGDNLWYMVESIEGEGDSAKYKLKPVESPA